MNSNDGNVRYLSFITNYCNMKLNPAHYSHCLQKFCALFQILINWIKHFIFINTQIQEQ